MAKVLQHRRGTTAEHSNFTGAAGEITFDTTAKRLVAHDGSTKGGIPVATKQEVEQVANSLDPRILDAASQADILEAVGQVTGGGSVSQPTLEGLQSQISANASNIVKPARYVVEKWSSGTEWYTKYKDGWVEQGGFVSLGVNSAAEARITFPVPFLTANYFPVAQIVLGSTGDGSTRYMFQIFKRTAEGMYVFGNSAGDFGAAWYACGY